MSITKRGRVLAATTTLGQVAGAAFAWHQRRGVLAGVFSALVGGLVGVLGGQALANANQLPPGLLTHGLDADAPGERPADGSEIDGYVGDSQRPYYDLLQTAKVASEDKFQPIGFTRTTPVPALTA